MPLATVKREVDATGDSFAVFDDGAGGSKSQAVTVVESDGTTPRAVALESGGNLAAILAKLIAAPATEAKQDALATAVGLLAKLTDTQPISARQTVDADNTTVYTDATAQYVGAWTQTRSLGIVRQLVVLASTVPSGLGGTFIFEYGEDGSTATISETRTIGDFATVRDFDLINAGEYFRVKFTPSRTVTAAEFVFITTTHRRQNDGAFVRLANQEIEEANAAMGQAFAYQKNFNKFSGKSQNVRADSYVPAMGSTTPLGIASTFDSGVVDLSEHNYIVTHIVSDVAGSAETRFYSDSAGTNQVRAFTRPYTAGETAWYGSKLYAPYVRIIYTNGGTGQATFYIATKVHNQAMSGQVLGIGEFVPTNILAAVTRTAIMGINPAGAYRNVSVNKSDNLIVADFLTEVAKGNIPGHTLVNRIGYNPDIDSGASETIWNGGTIYAFPASAGVIACSSGSALDTAAGTGARTVLIEGLNASYETITETVTLDGVVPVNTSASFLRVSRVSVMTAGSTAANQGELSFTIAAVSVATIPVGNNRSAIGIYTVPAGKIAYLLDLNVQQSNNSASSISGAVWATEGESLIFLRRDSFGGHSQSGGMTKRYIAPIAFPEKSDIRIDAIAGANNNEVHASFNLLLVDN